MSSSFKKCLVVLLFPLVLSSAAWAQGVASGSLEVSARVDVSSLNGITGHHADVGSGYGVAYNLDKYVAVGFDYDYLSLGSLSTYASDGFNIFQVKESEHLQTFDGTVRVSLLKTRFAVPYVVGSAGAVSLAASAKVVGTSGAEGNDSASQHGASFGAGGGVSLYVTRHIGIRPEVRYERQQFKATTIDNIQIQGGGVNDARASVGVFFQFGGHRQR
jgi:opacity protein-like surface antigen